MKIRHSLAALVALSISTPALAFDLPPPVEAPEYTGDIAAADGWYIRGDLGYVQNLQVQDPSFREFNSASQTASTVPFNNARMSGDYTLSAGAGYQFNDFLRTDLTVDYFKAKLSGEAIKNSKCSAWQPANTRCGYALNDSMSALGLLANGYVDLGTYWGLTPYVGAGAGVSNVDWNTMKSTKHCIGNTCNTGIDYKTEEFEGAESWRFTYALMAGISYDVSENTKIDFGYRYSKIAGGDMFNWSTAERNAGAKGIKAGEDGLSRHEFRAGLRLTGW